MPLFTADIAACAKCRFFDDEASAELGLCRYNPPIGQSGGNAAAIWPKVAAADWCGHFEAADA